MAMRRIMAARGPPGSPVWQALVIGIDLLPVLRPGYALASVARLSARLSAWAWARVAPMRYTVLPGTEIRVSVIAMGCWALAGDSTWGEQSDADSIAAVRAALDAGINFFDTAPGYGDGLSERRLGQGLQGL